MSTKWTVWLLVGTTWCAGLALLTLPVARLTARMSLNYNEGWNAYQIEEVVRSGRGYPPRGALITNNYPPLSFYVIASVARVTGDPIIAGRVVAIVSFMVVAAAIAFVVASTTQQAAAAFLASGVFVLFGTLRWTDYLGMDDPQWLAQAVAMLGVALLVGSDRPRAAGIAGTLIAVAMFIKHSLLALPVALIVCAVLTPSRKLRLCATTFVVSALALAVAFTSVLGPALWAGILTTPRDMSVWYVSSKLDQFLTPAAPLAAVAALGVALSRDRRRLLLPIVYFAMALGWGLLSLAGDGTNVNLTFDVVISLCLVVGMLAGECQARQGTSGLMPWFVTAVVAPLFLAVPIAALEQWTALQRLDVLRADARNDIAMLERIRGPVVCESLALCYWAGKPWEFDAFNTAQKLRTGRMPTDGVVRLLSDRRFAAIQVHSPVASAIGWMPADVNAALAAHYVPARRSTQGTVLVPR